MKSKYFTAANVAFRLWVLTAMYFAFSVFGFSAISGEGLSLSTPILSFIVSLVGSGPAFIVLVLALPILRNFRGELHRRFLMLLGLQLLITIPYGLMGALTHVITSFDVPGEYEPGFLLSTVFISAVLFLSSVFSIATTLKPVFWYLNNNREVDNDSYPSVFNRLIYQPSKLHFKMETSSAVANGATHSNRILVKGLITGALILIMLIPTVFINNLIEEREARQKEVVKEVSSKWAAAQTLSAPFLVVPYTDTLINSDGKSFISKTNLLLLADELNVDGQVIPEERPRSIYKVLLYKSDINMKGNFRVKWPSDINPGSVDYANAKLCFTLSDFKGIEEEIYVYLNEQKLMLTPGMPIDDFGKVGLSVPVSLDAGQTVAGIPFSMHVKIKGSEQLHFVPMSAGSKFSLKSAWPSPSFDGDMLPNEREVKESGFTARWNFNQANLPFATVMRENTVVENKLAFGVSLVQPADQYNKTMRSVKYAILFIGLTFAFFFIIELMQKRPFHPVQYVLVGLALVIFYSLLLSISEYILFDNAYLIAALATIMLISLYAKGHFRSWKTAGIFFSLLSCLYGFIFILIRLEDTALLVGSIGLFIVLALVMFASRKINWYGSNNPVISTPEIATI
jgi:inner membrane protein